MNASTTEEGRTLGRYNHDTGVDEVIWHHKGLNVFIRREHLGKNVRTTYKNETSDVEHADSAVSCDVDSKITRGTYSVNSPVEVQASSQLSTTEAKVTGQLTRVDGIYDESIDEVIRTDSHVESVWTRNCEWGWL